jgi:hypothetical protein
VVREVKVSVHFSIIKLGGDCVMGILINRPDKADQVQAEIFAIAPPWRGSRLKGFVYLGLPGVLFVSLSNVTKTVSHGSVRSLAVLIDVSSAVVVFNPVEFLLGSEQFVQTVRGACSFAMAIHQRFSAIDGCGSIEQGIMKEWRPDFWPSEKFDMLLFFEKVRNDKEFAVRSGPVKDVLAVVLPRNIQYIRVVEAFQHLLRFRFPNNQVI